MENSDVTPPLAPAANGAPLPPPIPAPPVLPAAGAGAPPVPAVLPAPTGRPTAAAPAPPVPLVTKTPSTGHTVPPMPPPTIRPAEGTGLPPVSKPALGSRGRSGGAAAGTGSSRKSTSPLQGERDPLPPGTHVGKYTITAKIGIGGFGIVYSATHTQDGTPVAIKEHMPEGLTWRDPNGVYVQATPESEARFKATVGEFLEEVSVLMGISHPGIVPILTAFEANGTAYYVMPFQKGTPMAVVEQSSLDTSQQAQEARHNKRLLLSLLSTLDYLRMHKIVHRDIKPDNILITEEGNTVLLDFGSARQLQPGKVFTNVYTPDFSAPEQAHAESDAEMSESLGPWTDIYSLGVCFYYLITHLFPPRADLRMISAVDPYTPLAGRADLEYLYGASFLKAIDRALELKISDRWQNAAAWRIAIGEGMVPTPQKKKRRIRTSALVTAAALALFAGVSVWALRERALALRAFEHSMNFNGRLLYDFSQEITDVPGSSHMQHLLGEHLNTYLSSMERPSGVEDEKYRRTLASAWRNYGAICTQQERLEDADNAYDKALALLKQLAENYPQSMLYTYDLANVLLDRAELSRLRHNDTNTRRYIAEAKATLRQLCAKAPYNPDFLCTLGQALTAEAQQARAEGDTQAHTLALKKMLALYRKLLSDFPEHIKARKGLGYALQYAARQSVLNKDYGEATQQLEESRQLFADLSSQYPYHLSFRKGLSLAYFYLGVLNSRLSSTTADDKQKKQYDDLALDAYRKHNDLVSHLEAQVENKAEFSYMYCRALSNMVDILLRIGQPNLAEAHCKTIIRKTDELRETDPDNEDYALMAAQAWRDIAKAHSRTTLYAGEAAEALRQFRSIVEKLYEQAPQDAAIRFLYTEALQESARQAQAEGKTEQARSWLKQAQTILQDLIRELPSQKDYATGLEQISTQLQALPEQLD